MIDMPVLAASKPREVEYRCPSCGWWLFSSTATWGKVIVKCGNRRCSWKGGIYVGQRNAERVLE